MNRIIRFATVCFLMWGGTFLHADDMILVVGAGGSEEYTKQFVDWADKWKAAATDAEIEFQEIGRGEKKDYELLKSAIEEQKKESEQPLWLVLLGHGTFDRNVAKFNLRGKDIESKELQKWLEDCERPLILINGFSCSGAFLQPLQKKNRVVISATKNGAELNFSRFGGYLAESLADMEADLDHDDQVSLLEAFLLASSKVNTFYESDARLVTEHALLEDNADGKGISADFFVGIRAEMKAKGGAALDGQRAHRYILKASDNAVQLSPEKTAERNEIETAIEQLRSRKSKMSADDYYNELEGLMVQMAKLYQPTDSVQEESE